jgi:hypothetical protein
MISAAVAKGKNKGGTSQAMNHAEENFVLDKK